MSSTGKPCLESTAGSTGEPSGEAAGEQFGSADGTFLEHPSNRTTPRIFVAATRQNDGKTTTCLGLYGALRHLGHNVGYIKPVAQRLIEVDGHLVDEDTQLISAIYDVNIPIQAMSPIAIDSSFTRRYLDHPEELRPVIVDRLCRAFDCAAREKDIVIIEGSGHAGVGSVFDCSNAHCAGILGAKCVLVAGGGIGRPVDEIAINKALLDRMGVECIGVILNKVLADKIEFVREYVGRGLRHLGVPLIGVLPLVSRLARPNLSQVVSEIDGRWVNFFHAERGSDRVLKVIMGAMSANTIADHLGRGVLVILPGDRDDLLYALSAYASSSDDPVACGIILTNNLVPKQRILDMLAKARIPVVRTEAESFTVTAKINNMTVKTQPEDTDKIPHIERIVRDNIDLNGLLRRL
ncbi:MAG: AAA family ATPase [Puniceicoccales bacterium]|jgi:BioD-like phosphotransacetylase family protein|nr:AAA family ATPase [Puniceicoccales bacterium]